MNKVQCLKLVIVLALGLMMAALVVLVGVDPWHLVWAAPLDTPRIGPQVSIWTDAVDNGEPVVAYNSVRDEYLVVWEDYNASEIAIYGRRVGSDGQPLDSRIAIAAYPTYTSTQPAVAYSPVLDQYLVAYIEDSKPSDPPYHEKNLVACVVTGDGTNLCISQGAAILIDTWTPRQAWHPAIAYNSQDDEFVVVWEVEHGEYGAPNLRRDIYARRVYSNTVTGDWELSDERCVVTGDPGSGGDGRNRVRPDVTYNADHNQVLIAYTQEGPPDTNVLAKLAAANLDGVFVSSEITICAQAYGQDEVAVAAAPDEYLAVWQNEDSSGKWDVYGRRLRGSAGLPLGPASGFVINNFLLAHSLVPEVAYGPIYGYMVAFQTDDSDYGGSWGDDVYGNYVLVGQEAPTDEPFFVDGGMYSSQRQPDVTCNPRGDCLVVDADDHTGDYEIDGQFLLAYRVYLPLVLRNWP
jgi:hypothetical protein